MHQRRKKVMTGILAGIFLFSIFFSKCDFGIREAKADPSGNNVVINEVGIDSISGTGGSADDWVELYNPTESDIDLDGWSIQKTTNSGSSLVRAPLNGSIPANGYFLIVRNQSTSTASFIPPADVSTSNSFSLAAGNIVYLVNDNENISSTTNPYEDENIVDFVGFGPASFYEGSSSAPAIPEEESISRIPDGEDTDQNGLDFEVLDTPTPRNSHWGEEPEEPSNDIGGTVLITIMPDAEPVQNITATGADVVFQVNALGQAVVNYGLSDIYGSSTVFAAVATNTTATISLSGLTCSTTYHYEIYAENVAGTESDQTADATFATMPCGISVDSLVMTKTSARANDQYGDGWEWEFGLTVWDLNETSLRMKFNQWSGANFLDAVANMRYSADDGATWVEIDADDAYPSEAIDISAIDEDAAMGRQVEILVRMKVPFGTSAGYYNSGYGILTE